jgi:hypothetical protein
MPRDNPEASLPLDVSTCWEAVPTYETLFRIWRDRGTVSRCASRHAARDANIRCLVRLSIRWCLSLGVSALCLSKSETHNKDQG